MDCATWVAIAVVIGLCAFIASMAHEGWPRRFLLFLLCFGWDYDDDSENGFRELATFSSIWVTEWLAFAAFLLREPQFNPRVSAFFAAICCVPLIGLAFLVWGHKMKDNRVTHSSKVQTVHCAALMALFILATTSASLYEYAYGQFPTQGKPKSLELLDAVPTKFDVGSAEYHVEMGDGKVVATFAIEAHHFPDPLTITIGDSTGLPAEWRIINCKGIEVVEHQPNRSLDNVVPDIASDERTATVTWNAMHSGRRYILEVVFHQRHPNTSTPADVASLIKSRKIVTAKAYLGD